MHIIVRSVCFFLFIKLNRLKLCWLSYHIIFKAEQDPIDLSWFDIFNFTKNLQRHQQCSDLLYPNNENVCSVLQCFI